MQGTGHCGQVSSLCNSVAGQRPRCRLLVFFCDEMKDILFHCGGRGGGVAGSKSRCCALALALVDAFDECGREFLREVIDWGWK